MIKGHGGIFKVVDGGALASGGRPALDSGAITMYRPATVSKPQRWLNRVARTVRQFRGRDVQPSQTTQQGSAAASPTTYQQTLWPQRWEKAQYVADCEQQWFNDPACFKACNMYVYEAVRGGVQIRVSGDSSMEKDAQDIANEYLKLWPSAAGADDGVSLFGGGLCGVLTGEFWPQAACAGRYPDGYINNFLTLPTAGMERNTDDADQFVDPQLAYSQIDTLTFEDVGRPFPYWSTWNGRWNYVPGSKNGNPEIISVRRFSRLLELMEASKVTQVQVRAPMRYLWQFGTAENPASPQEVRELMYLNGFVEGKREIFDPSEVARDMWVTGASNVTAVEGDGGVGEVDHLKYMLDRYANALPTPRQLMSLGSENINRDVLKEIRAQWMADTVRVNQFLDGPIKFFFELALMLQAIPPDAIKYETKWTKSTTETEQERIDSVNAMYEGGIISLKTAVESVREYTGIADVDEEMKLIQEGAERSADLEMKKHSAGVPPAQNIPGKRVSLQEKNAAKTNGQAVRRN